MKYIKYKLLGRLNCIILSLLLSGIIFLNGCDSDDEKVYGTPPVISNIHFRLYKGLDIDYSEEPEITEWKEGDIVLVIVTMIDEDMDIISVTHQFKNIDNNTKKISSQSPSQDKNPYSIASTNSNLTPGSWIYKVDVKDKGNNITTFEFDKTITVKSR